MLGHASGCCGDYLQLHAKRQWGLGRIPIKLCLRWLSYGAAACLLTYLSLWLSPSCNPMLMRQCHPVSKPAGVPLPERALFGS